MVPQTGDDRQLDSCYSSENRMGMVYCWICQMKIHCFGGSLVTGGKAETFTKSVTTQ